MMWSPDVHFFILPSVKLCHFPSGIIFLDKRKSDESVVGFTPAADGCDRLPWSIRVGRICALYISITGGKWISLRNGFGHEVGGPVVAIIFPRRHKVWRWAAMGRWSFYFSPSCRPQCEVSNPECLQNGFISSPTTVVNCVVAWHFGVWDRRHSPWLCDGLAPSPKGRTSRTLDPAQYLYNVLRALK